jgi:hypothetical protein
MSTELSKHSKKIVFLPRVETQEQLEELFCRAAWHFQHLHSACFDIYISPNLDVNSNFAIPEKFDPGISDCINDFVDRCSFVKSQENNPPSTSIDGVDAIVKWVENDDELNEFLKTKANCTIYHTDPAAVRQEGSFYIQCAYDLIDDKEALVDESREKFNALFDSLPDFEVAWVLATGPSVEGYVDHDFSSALTIACNSTVLDNELMKHCQPRILVFADPIFHFGVSSYAGAFRKVVAQVLAENDIYVVIPLKYYALLKVALPEFQSRIIGVPLKNDMAFNFDLQENFSVRTTANILTLLLLPVAATFSDDVKVLGCDGRPLDEDDYFWGHGKKVQINDKMENIREVHPGFFDINYNEYYFEHLHTLSNMIGFGAEAGKSFTHEAPSYIPAFSSSEGNAFGDSEPIVLLEPDGLGMNGHYVDWHNQLIEELESTCGDVQVFCNLKQDPALYRAEATPVFSSHSWGISRSDWCFHRNFEEHNSYVQFFEELERALLNYLSDHGVTKVTLFIYYGSIQILAGLHKLRKRMKQKGCELKVSLCLFHESVILDPNRDLPRCPPQTSSILQEALAQTGTYRVAAVTVRLSDYLFAKYSALPMVMPNPIPAPLNFPQINDAPDDGASGFRVLFPCALREEKGGLLVEQLAKDVAMATQLNDDIFILRRPDEGALDGVNGLEYFEDDIDLESYAKLLQAADVVVIPYLAPAFTFRTSGIIVDAFKAGKPVICVRGTWLADTAEQIVAGLGIDYHSSFSFLSAIKVIKEHYEFFEGNARKASTIYEKEHNWPRLVDIMLR